MDQAIHMDTVRFGHINHRRSCHIGFTYLQAAG